MFEEGPQQVPAPLLGDGGYGQLLSTEHVESASGAVGYATIEVEASQSGTVEVCTSQTGGCTDITAHGSWESAPNAPGWAIFTNNAVPVNDLNFPNLDLTSTTVIAPPTPAPNYVKVTGPAGTAIAWARINVLGVRPVVLVHGVANGRYTLGSLAKCFLTFTLAACPKPSSDATHLSGWSTWKYWVASSVTLSHSTVQGYLRAIGVPNIRPFEETAAAASIPPPIPPIDSTNPNYCSTLAESLHTSPGYYASDIRAYVAGFGRYDCNAQIVNNQIYMVRTRYGVDKVNIVAHSMGGLDAAYAAETSSGSIENLIMLDTPYAGTPLADFFLTGEAGLPILLGGVLRDLALERYVIENYSPGIEELSPFQWCGGGELGVLCAYLPTGMHHYTIAGNDSMSFTILPPLLDRFIFGVSNPVKCASFRILFVT